MEQQKRFDKFKESFYASREHGNILQDAHVILRWILQMLIPKRFYCCREQTFEQLFEHKLPLFNDLMAREGVLVSGNDLQSVLFELADLLEQDAVFICESDPAAGSVREVKMFSAGYLSIAIYRLARAFYVRNARYTALAWSFYARSLTGIEIHPAAVIAVPFGIDHGNGVVIGETAEVEEKVLLYHGVTLGSKSVSKGLQQQKRHPKIEKGTTIYANATVLGGDTVIGRNSVIAANAFVNRSIPACSLVYNHMQVKPFGKQHSGIVSEYII